MKDAINNKWMRAAVPALLIHCSIGTVYCWSTFKTLIAEKIGAELLPLFEKPENEPDEEEE